MPADAERRVTLTVGSLEWRRRLGPTAWVVFEDLLLASTGADECCEAIVSVRVLAARLGLAKDTVARALIRLRVDGLVTATQSRAVGGVFAVGTYRITVPDAITVIDHTPPTTRDSEPNARRTSRSDVQLAFAIDA